MKINKKYILVGLGCFLFGIAFNIRDHIHHNTNSASVECSVCFTPGDTCTDKIIARIDSAQHEILVQSYSFTSIEIAQALIRAHKRGINVQMIFDNSQADKILIIQLYNAQIPIFIDKPAGIAHNKTMIIDEKIVLTGSFNFTKSAQHRNVENSICLVSHKIANQYKQAWAKRLNVSKKYQPINLEEAMKENIFEANNRPHSKYRKKKIKIALNSTERNA